MRYGSVCSGIEAATVAWKPLGWKCAFVAEVEPYCCHLLHKKYGASRPRFMPKPEDIDRPADGASEEELGRYANQVSERKNDIKLVKALPENGLPNLGDITQCDPSEFRGRIDVLVGGTPCQSFSVAGLRRGLNDARGNLALRFVEYADAIEPRYVAWENVPGVLSDSTNAFGCLLGGLVGADSALVPAKGQRWTNFGVVDGPKRRIAWRVLDAKWFGVAQRRERVFVVASARDAAHPLQILLEPESMQRNFAPSREAGQATAGTLNARTQGGGGLGTDFECGGGLQIMTSSRHLPQAEEALSDAAKAVDKIR